MEFLNKLSSDQLTLILNKCGLFVVDNIKDVIKEANKENADCYYIRAINFGETEYEDAGVDSVSRLIENIQLFGAKNPKINSIKAYLEMYEELKNNSAFGSYQNDLIDMYTITDFMLYRTMPIDPTGNYPSKRDCELDKKYYLTMCEKFRDEGYNEKFKKFIDTFESESVME